MTPGLGAACATHAGAPAVQTCARCGRFCCAACVASAARALCTECAPRFADPWALNRSFDLVDAVVTGVKLTLAELPKVLGIVALFSLSGAALQTLLAPDTADLRAVGTASRVSNLHDALLGIIGTQAILALLIARGEGRSLALGAALREGLAIWGRTLVARIRVGLWTLLFLLLLVIPGIWKATTLAFVTVAVLRSQGDDPLEASAELVRGRFWLVFGFLLFAGVALFLPMLVLIFLGGLVTEFLPTPRFIDEYVTEFISGVFFNGFMTGVLYVAYCTLHATVGRDLGEMKWRALPPLSSSRDA